jgi:hypothetical protein
MHKLLLLVTLLTAASAFAAPMEIKCLDCRDPQLYPKDYGNFAFNQVFGENSWISLSQGSLLKISNRTDRWAMVDLNHTLLYTPININLGIISSEFLMFSPEISITVYTDTGDRFRYPAIPSGSDLIVGEQYPALLSPQLNYYLEAPTRDRTSLSGSYIFSSQYSGYPGSHEGIVIVGPSY